MSDACAGTLLSDSELPVAEIANPAGSAPVCLVCEHASAAIPRSLGTMGLAAGDRLSHAVWDPGAETLARRLSRALDAPLVLARVSRIVCDCNRPPQRDDAMPARVETIGIPGNRGLSATERARRARAVYAPFHRAVTDALDRFKAPPALVTVHSFTPVWHGVARAAEIGLLHDADATLAGAMLRAAGGAFRTELNVPYSARDGVTHTLARHATARGLASVMIEVRNDLLANAAAADAVAGALEEMLRAALGCGKRAA